MHSGISIIEFILTFIVIIFAIGVHEYAHAVVGDHAGDPTPRLYGRVTMNPFKHLDPLGTLMIMLTLLAGFGIGWGKPVPLDPKRMRNPRWDHFWAVAAGPISNLLQAAAYALVMRLFLMYGLFQESELVWYVLRVGITVNLALCFFNLIPLGPLDGQWLVGAFLSEKTRYGWYRWNLQVGGFLLLMLIFVGQFNQNFDIIGNVVRPLVSQVASFLLGIKVV